MKDRFRRSSEQWIAVHACNVPHKFAEGNVGDYDSLDNLSIYATCTHSSKYSNDDAIIGTTHQLSENSKWPLAYLLTLHGYISNVFSIQSLGPVFRKLVHG